MLEATEDDPPLSLDYQTLSTLKGIPIKIPGTNGSDHYYFTTGNGTVVPADSKPYEYPICEERVERQSRRDIFMAYIDFGPAKQEISFTERVVMLPEEEKYDDVVQITTIPTRAEFFEALEAFHGRPINGDTFSTYCVEHGLYEILTQEYLEKLAEYMEERINFLLQKFPPPIVIVEVGAGDGKLTHFLDEKLKERGVTDYRIVATDGGKWGIKKLHRVEQETHKEALWDFQPHIVLSQWMCKTEDWTKDVRDEPSVQEYVLISPPDSNTCGLTWDTWGIPYTQKEQGSIPPYAQDGFVRVDLSELSELQLCQKDTMTQRHSATTSFRREYRASPLLQEPEFVRGAEFGTGAESLA